MVYRLLCEVDELKQENAKMLELLEYLLPATRENIFYFVKDGKVCSKTCASEMDAKKLHFDSIMLGTQGLIQDA